MTTANRFADTRDLLTYGVKLGLGKAAQEQAIEQAKHLFPEHGDLLENPMFLAGLKLALPLLGVQLSQHISSEALSARIHDASQGMLLLNTIDATAESSTALAGQLVGLFQFVLGLYGLSPAEAQEGAQQLAEDIGAAFAGAGVTTQEAA